MEILIGFNILMTIYWGTRSVKAAFKVIKREESTTFKIIMTLITTLIFEIPTFAISYLIYYTMEMIL